MTIAITKSIPVPQISPNCNATYWIAGAATIPNLSVDAKLNISGYYDQAGYDANPKCRPIAGIQVTIPSASVATALATDDSLGTYLLTLPQFSGGTAAEAA